MKLLLNCQCCFKFLGCGYTWKIFVGLGLTVTEIDIKKVHKHENKKPLKMYKDIGLACQNVCKEGSECAYLVMFLFSCRYVSITSLAEC